MKRLARSALVTLLTLAVFAGLLWFGDVTSVLTRVGRFQPGYLLWFLVVMLVHEVVRGILWYLLVRRLGSGARPAPLRAQTFAFAAGEAAKTLPMGAYVQNYLLQRSTGIDFARSSAATTVMILDEIVVAMVGVALLGVGAWSTWLRPAILAGAVAAFVLVRAHKALPRAPRAPRWIRERRLLDRVRKELARLRAGAAALAHPQMLIITLLLGAVYVFLDGVGLYVVVRALGIGGVSLWQAVAVRCFGLAFYIILGSLEAAGVAAFLSMGVSKSAAVSSVLVNRALGILITIILAALTMALLHGEWRSRDHAVDTGKEERATQPVQTPRGLHYEETQKAPS